MCKSWQDIRKDNSKIQSLNINLKLMSCGLLSTWINTLWGYTSNIIIMSINKCMFINSVTFCEPHACTPRAHSIYLWNPSMPLIILQGLFSSPHKLSHLVMKFSFWKITLFIVFQYTWNKNKNKKRHSLNNKIFLILHL